MLNRFHFLGLKGAHLLSLDCSHLGLECAHGGWRGLALGVMLLEVKALVLFLLGGY